ncbi:MAG: cell division protein FtsZ, partial [Candidatus Micrarchaeota archaeon]|nr:cell division protein FtsZ [Candidatus Micrarchaeota archaeon]
MFENVVGEKRETGEDLMSNDKVRIGVIGVGGAGCNTVDRMMKAGIKSAQTIAINTDQLHLKVVQAHKRMLIGSTVTRGLGAGGYPEVAQKCAEMSREKLKEVIGEK